MIEVETVRELLSKATPGPWAYKAGTMKHYAHSTDPGEDFGVSLQEMHWRDGREVPAEGNARLIAAAPDIAALALAQAAEIARLRELEAHRAACDAAELAGIAACLDGLPDEPPADLMDTAPYAGPREAWEVGWSGAKYEADLKAEIVRLREALEGVHKLQVGWWEEVIALMDPDADMTPALEERAEVLKRINHQLHAATQGSQ